jgi:hypothetical protein
MIPRAAQYPEYLLRNIPNICCAISRIFAAQYPEYLLRNIPNISRLAMQP